MNALSVVIIAKNESKHIVDCISSAKQISNDIIVADSGSTDGTQELAHQTGAKVVAVLWNGYGNTRNIAATFALNDWIFCIDADERITLPLADAIKASEFANSAWVYGCKRKSFWVQKKIKYGEWGRDVVYRLYNRSNTRWSLDIVHENIIADKSHKKLLEGDLLHYTAPNKQNFEAKTMKYAQLSAEKYYKANKPSNVIKRLFASPFSFIQNYIFRLGFLDGKEGFIIAKNSSHYIWLKYQFLHQMHQQKPQYYEEAEKVST